MFRSVGMSRGMEILGRPTRLALVHTTESLLGGSRLFVGAIIGDNRSLDSPSPT